MGHIFALDKQPGGKSGGIGDVVRSIITSFVLSIADWEATHTYGKLQLWGGVFYGTEGKSMP